jgi:sugar/nucleoside kinase (ribokinase family)
LNQQGNTAYLVIGHITVDDTPWGSLHGGTALFGAITAARLGARVHVLTSMPEDASQDVLPPEVQVHNVPSKEWLTLRHVYVDGVRQQYLVSVASPLRAADVPVAWRTIPVVHFGPLAQEVDHELLASFQGSLRGASVQGWLRRWGPDGKIEPVDTQTMLAWAPPVDISFLSEEDIGGERAIIDFYRRQHKIVALTDGRHGATIFEEDTVIRVPAFPVTEVDANGAGDVFAAAFLIRYHETGDALLAAQFACVVASFHVEQQGTSGIPTRAQAEARLLEYARIR